MSAYLAWDDGFFRFDAVLNENHNLDSEITTHPVEVGSDIADNMRILPKVVTMTGIISQAPIYSLDSSLQSTGPLDLFDPNHDPSNITRAPNSQTVQVPQPPILFSLNSGINALGAVLDGSGSINIKTSPAAMTRESQQIAFQTYQSESRRDYISEAYEVLRNIQATAQLCTVFGGV